MMELGGRDFRAIEAHWNGMQRNGRVRSAEGRPYTPVVGFLEWEEQVVLTERPAGYGRSGEPRAAQSVGGAQEAPCQEPGDSETTDVEARGNLDADAWEWLVGCEEAAQRKAQAAERERGRDNMTVVLKHLRTTGIYYLRQHPPREKRRRPR